MRHELRRCQCRGNAGREAQSRNSLHSQTFHIYPFAKLTLIDGGDLFLPLLGLRRLLELCLEVLRRFG